MKASSATSGPETSPSSGLRESTATSASLASPHSSPADGGYRLAGPSDLPDPATHAYRSDLADVALAGRVIASHYAEPLARQVTHSAALLVAPDDAAPAIGALAVGESVRVLDIRSGWAWGYGPGGQVGYVRCSAIAA